MISITVVGHGKEKEVSFFVSAVRSYLTNFLSKYEANVYDICSSWKLEAVPSLFEKKNVLRFPRSDGAKKYYIESSTPCDEDKPITKE